MSQTEAGPGQSLPLLGEDVSSKVVPSVNPMLIRIETLGPGNARLVPTPFVKPRREQNHHPTSTSLSCTRKPKMASDSAYSSLQPNMRIINTDPIRQRRKRRTKQEMDALRAEMMDKKRTLQESGIRVPSRRGPGRISSMDSVVRHSRQFDLQAVKNSVLLPEETCAMLRPCCLANDGCRTLCWHSPINGRIGDDSLPTMAQVVKWSVNDVGDFLFRFGLENETIHRFKEQLIDGEALLLLTRDDLIAQLAMKLGPAIKLQNRLLLMKHLNVERVC